MATSSKKKLFVSSGLALAMMSMTVPAHTQSTTENLTDIRQEVQIWTTYSLNPYLRSSALKATVKDGKATLTGSVPEGVNKELAQEIALGVSGIKDVDNQITIDAEKPSNQSTPMDNFGDAIDDATISVAVKSKLLWSKYTEGLNTMVDTKSGRVTLTGTADSKAALELAGQLARNTRGVISVKNLITVVPAVAAAPGHATNQTGAPAGKVATNITMASAEQMVSDTWITTKVKSTFLYSTNVAGNDITVNTIGGIVTLSGKLDSGAEKALAIELAQNIRGVKSIQAKSLTH